MPKVFVLTYIKLTKNALRLQILLAHLRLELLCTVPHAHDDKSKLTSVFLSKLLRELFFDEGSFKY